MFARLQLSVMMMLRARSGHHFRQLSQRDLVRYLVNYSPPQNWPDPELRKEVTFFPAKLELLGSLRATQDPEHAIALHQRVDGLPTRQTITPGSLNVHSADCYTKPTAPSRRPLYCTTALLTALESQRHTHTSHTLSALPLLSLVKARGSLCPGNSLVPVRPLHDLPVQRHVLRSRQ